MPQGKRGPLFKPFQMKQTEHTPVRTETLKQKAVFVAKVFGGLLLAPILFILFIADRIVLVFLPHIQPQTVQECFRNLSNYRPILYRLGFVAFAYFLKILFEFLF